MTKSLWPLLLTVIIIVESVLFMPQVYAIKAQGNSQDDEVVRTISQINQLRDIYGLPPFDYNDNLNQTAQTHNRYMDINKSFSSIEEMDKTYFRGRYPWDRAAYNNYANTYVFELIGRQISNYYSGLQMMLLNPYARYAILDPLYEDLGMDTFNGYTTYLFGGRQRSGVNEVVYPYNKQTDVEPFYRSQYVVNPFQGVNKASENYGVPITYTYYMPSGNIQSFENLSVTLRNLQTNKIVPNKIVTSIDDANLNNTLMILPLEEYNLGTTYRCTIRGNAYFNKTIMVQPNVMSNTRRINVDIVFTTASTLNKGQQEAYLKRANFVKALVKAIQLPLREALKSPFTDVSVNEASFKYIYTGYVNGLVLGYGNGQFRPNVNISREQVYTILIRAYEKQIATIPLTDQDRKLSFSDVNKINTYALESIYKAKKLGILTDNSYAFNPSIYITNTEFSQILERYNEVIQ